MTATMLVKLPWTPVRGNFIKLNTDKNPVGKRYMVTINGKLYSGRIATSGPFWRSTTDVGLDFYLIESDYTIVVDAVGDCPNIESITLKVDGANVPITLKS